MPNETETVATLGEREFFVQRMPTMGRSVKWYACDRNTRTATMVRKQFKTREEAVARCIAWCDALRQLELPKGEP